MKSVAMQTLTTAFMQFRLSMAYDASCWLALITASGPMLTRVCGVSLAAKYDDWLQKNLKAAVASGSFPAGHQLGFCLCEGLQEFQPQQQR
jgi:hydroxyethylthiazole kinase-like sugar kinase family protein